MRVAILAGGLGTRLSEETALRPKPMVEVGGQPILWHIMKYYAAYGFNQFVVALGYKGEVIKQYFLNYHYSSRSMTIRLNNGEIKLHEGHCDDWTVHLLETGISTQTGGRVKQIIDHVGRAPFMLTYGDGVSNLNITRLLEFHRSHGRLATVTAVRPPARFGGLAMEGDLVTRFAEKPQTDEGWINGGFFVLEPAVADYIDGDETIFEREPLERLARDGQLMAYKHYDFWQCMDTLRELNLLEDLWQRGKAPWKVW